MFQLAHTIFHLHNGPRGLLESPLYKCYLSVSIMLQGLYLGIFYRSGVEDPKALAGGSLTHPDHTFLIKICVAKDILNCECYELS